MLYPKSCYNEPCYKERCVVLSAYCENKMYEILFSKKKLIELIDTVEHRFKHEMSFAFPLFFMFVLFMCYVKLKSLATIPTKTHFAQYKNTSFNLGAKND